MIAKNKNEVLKQLRILSKLSVEALAEATGLSQGYINRLEAGEVENLSYIYGKYAKALRIQEGKIRRMAERAEKENWSASQIVAEVRSLVE